MRRMSAATKGITPRQMAVVGTSGSTLDSTKMFMPIGGVMRLISITHTTMMPNHTGSKPSEVTSGKNTGTVSSIIDRLSIAVPSTT